MTQGSAERSQPLTHRQTPQPQEGMTEGTLRVMKLLCSSHLPFTIVVPIIGSSCLVTASNTSSEKNTINDSVRLNCSPRIDEHFSNMPYHSFITKMSWLCNMVAYWGQMNKKKKGWCWSSKGVQVRPKWQLFLQSEMIINLFPKTFSHSGEITQISLRRGTPSVCPTPS